MKKEHESSERCLHRRTGTGDLHDDHPRRRGGAERPFKPCLMQSMSPHRFESEMWRKTNNWASEGEYIVQVFESDL